MRASWILGLLMGLLAALLLSNQLATSQEERSPTPGQEGRGRYQIAGHSTYPPLLLDSETGTAWILMSTPDGEERRWIWERIEMSPVPQNEEEKEGRGVARVPQSPQRPKRQLIF